MFEVRDDNIVSELMKTDCSILSFSRGEDVWMNRPSNWQLIDRSSDEVDVIL